MVYKTPKDIQERKDAKKKHIQETALKVFTAGGYHGTSVKDIVDEARVSVGSFYFYFKSKEDLFETLYDEVAMLLFNALDCAIGTVEKNKTRAFTRGITSFLIAVQENRELTKLMMIEAVGLNPRFEKKRMEAARMFTDNAVEHFERWKSEGEIDLKNTRNTAAAFIGSIYYTIESWLQGNLECSLEELALNLVTYNIQAFKLEYDENEIRDYIKEILNIKANRGNT